MLSPDPIIAISIIAKFCLQIIPIIEIKAVMLHDDARLIDALGGTTEVARLVKTSTSTVHSWRENGIPASRLDHIKLAAEARGKADALATVMPEMIAADHAAAPIASPEQDHV